MGIEALVEAIDELIAEEPAAHCDAASVRCLVRQLTRLESVTTTAVAAFDTSGDWSVDGAKTAAAWVSTMCRLPRAMGRRLVRRGRHLRHLPVVAQAFEEGEITSAHLDTVAGLRREGTDEALARDEALLVKQATRLRFDNSSGRPPIGTSWPIPTAPRTQPRRGEPGATSTSRRRSRGCTSDR